MESPPRHDSAWPIVLALVALIIIAVAVFRWEQRPQSSVNPPGGAAADCGQAGRAFRAHGSGVWLSLSGTVTRLLPDSDGARTHQRFIVACLTGQTILIVNDVSIGQRAPVEVGDRVAVRGQYIWNPQGGLVHFTHHALGGSESGWILVGGTVYSLGTVPLY